MAQEYAKVFADSFETQIAKGSYPLISAGRVNKSVNFVPISNVDGLEYKVQRMKRVKAKNLPAITGGLATRAIAMLDQATQQSWDTLTTKTTDERVLIVSKRPWEEFNPTLDGNAYARSVGNAMETRLVEAEELLTQKLWAVAQANGLRRLDLDTLANVNLAFEALKQERVRIGVKVDDYKAYSKNLFLLIHPSFLSALASVAGNSYFPHGGVFENGLPYDGLLAGIPYKESYLLNTLQTNTSTFCAGILYDPEAIAYQDPTLNVVPISNTIGTTSWQGIAYQEVSLVIDPARVKALWFNPNQVGGIPLSPRISA